MFIPSLKQTRERKREPKSRGSKVSRWVDDSTNQVADIIASGVKSNYLYSDHVAGYDGVSPSTFVCVLSTGERLGLGKSR